ncbi:MAG TPA: ABC transporter permease [Natronosporangium sp.]
MTTATAPRAATPAARPTTRGDALAGTGKLIRFNLRRDRIRLPVWIAVLGGIQLAGPAAYLEQFPTAADRAANATVMAENPALKAFTGPGHGLDNYTYGAMMGNEYLGLMLIFVALMSVLTVVRHTRTEEETGRAELVRSAPIGRHAYLTAALATAAIANVALGLLVAVGMAGQGIESIDWPGSLTFGAAYVVVGLFFAGVAAVTVQISEFARAASGMAGAVIAVSYGLRAIGDAGENGVSWLSPIGWAQASAPYVDNNWWPLGLALAGAVGLAAAGYRLSTRRDYGAGLRPERPGRATAPAGLGSPLGLAWRLHRASIGWWTVALLFGAFGYGSAIDAVEGYEDNEFVQQMVEQIGGSMTEAFLALSIAILAIVCAVFAVLTMLRPRREEIAGRAEPVLATAVSRTGWLASHLVIALAGSVFLLLVTGVGLGGGAALVTGESHYLSDAVPAILTYTPAVWLLAGLATAGFGVLPRVTGLAWALLGYAGVVAYFGGLLDLPSWLLNLSPFEHVPRLPIDDFTAVPLLVLTAIAAALAAVGLVGFRRRDLDSK